MDLNLVRQLCRDSKLRWTNHILKRLIQRNISLEDVQYVILNGEVIEDYPNDYPFPSCLICGIGKAGNIIHVVCSVSDGSDELWLITAYFPDSSKWSDDFKIRKVE